MKLAAMGVHGAPVIDPVCGMGVDEATARAARRASQHAGKTYFFCNDSCRKEFDANPAQYVGETKAATAGEAVAIDPVCGMKVKEAKAQAAGRVTSYGGKTYYFCNDSCKEEFIAAPEKFSGASGRKATGISDPAKSGDGVSPHSH